MEEDYKLVKDKISTNNAAMVADVRTKVDEIIKLINDKKPNNVIVTQLKNIIKIVTDNGAKLDKLLNDLMAKVNDINDNLKELNSNSKRT